MTALLVVLGGSLGAVLRFVLDGELKARRTMPWPGATFAINAVGSFVLGLVSGTHPSAHVAAFVTTGICGGFTTFSTASVESVGLLRERRPGVAAAYAFGTVLVCLVLVIAGSSLTS